MHVYVCSDRTSHEIDALVARYALWVLFKRLRDPLAPLAVAESLLRRGGTLCGQVAAAECLPGPTERILQTTLTDVA